MSSPSPRRRLLDGFALCLSRITVANGFITDAGLTWTSEPHQVDARANAVLTAVIEKQQRAADPALVRTHRLTTVAVLAKVPAGMEDYQARLDEIVSDIEQAIEGQQKAFPVGVQFPTYVAMEPLSPEAGAGWVGAAVTFHSHIPIK